MSDGHGNWLQTVGIWLAKPFKTLAHPWWERLVLKRADSEAVRAKLLDAVTGFRVADFQRSQNTSDPARAHGIAHQVVERLRSAPTIDGKTDWASPATVSIIEREVELQAVPLTSWVQLACLANAAPFNPSHVISTKFTDGRGTQSVASNMICSIQKSYPFTQVLALDALDRARVSDAGIALLAEFCARVPLPEIGFDILASMPQPQQFTLMPDRSRTLRQGWSPNKLAL